MSKKLYELDRHARDSMSNVVTFAHWCIWAVTAVIAFVFAGLTLKDIPFAALSGTNPEYFQAIILSVYIWCWAAGTAIDTSVQDSVYLVDPEGGRVRQGAAAAVFAFAVIAVVLLLLRFNELYFALALFVFTTADVLVWLYLRKIFLPPIIDATYRSLKKDEFGKLRLQTVVSQISGNWKWWRQVLLFAIVLLMILVALSPPLKEVVSEDVHAVVKTVMPEAISPLLQDLLLLLFVLVSEIWYFALRLKTYQTIRLLDELEKGFRLKPRQKSA